VSIPSTIDGKTQFAYRYVTTKAKPQPLIVSLHTWSGNYAQIDSLALFARQQDWNYVHPDFRGPNWTPQACCSQYALQDIEDALDHTIRHGNVDTSQIHVVGLSGGGYATLCTYMKSNRRIKSFSAWVPISDLVAWHGEALVREPKHAQDILDCTAPQATSLDTLAAKARSPYFMQTPLAARAGSQLLLYTGICDGHTGAVPITHSILFFNKLVEDYTQSGRHPQKVSPSVMGSLLKNCEGREKLPIRGKMAGRKVFLKRMIDQVGLVVFDGGHELLGQEARANLLRQVKRK
jgi:pimeloyl-ACP methyl ester carboxylesterase